MFKKKLSLVLVFVIAMLSCAVYSFRVSGKNYLVRSHSRKSVLGMNAASTAAVKPSLNIQAAEHPSFKVRYVNYMSNFQDIINCTA